MFEVTETLIAIPQHGCAAAWPAAVRQDIPDLKISTVILAAHGVTVWIARPADLSALQMGSLQRLLDSHERDRAARLHFEADRTAYMLAHGLRRLAVGQALKMAPGSLRFSKRANGCPTLDTACTQPIFFSHSHTREVVACAVSRVRPVGIDAECISRTLPDLEWLAPYVALSGVQKIDAASGTDTTRQRSFLKYWTALEAFWKAAGTGLTPFSPRISCTEKLSSCTEVTTVPMHDALHHEALHHKPLHHDFLRAKVVRLPAPEGCVISLALPALLTLPDLPNELLRPNSTIGPAGAFVQRTVKKTRNAASKKISPVKSRKNESHAQT